MTLSLSRRLVLAAVTIVPLPSCGDIAPTHTRMNVTFAIRAGPLAASVLGVQAGNGQTAVAGSAVVIPPAILVTDRFGNPIPNVSVTFAVASGGGTVGGVLQQTTNANGVATVGSWT